MSKATDIDIDFANRDEVLNKLRHVVARIDRENGYEKHKTGVYFQPIPRNPLDNIATLGHKDADTLGYFKLDFLNNSVYQHVSDEAHLIELMNKEPMWELLEIPEIVEKLAHINNYTDLVGRMKPKNIHHLAMLLAVIRPAKAHLKNKSWEEIEKTVWDKPTDGQYYFKKSHSYAFAMSIIVQLNSLVEEANNAT